MVSNAMFKTEATGNSEMAYLTEKKNSFLFFSLLPPDANLVLAERVNHAKHPTVTEKCESRMLYVLRLYFFNRPKFVRNGFLKDC